MGLRFDCGAGTDAIEGKVKEQEAIDAMRAAAAHALRKDCDIIASGMAKKAAEGDTRSGRFLCDLANEHKELTAAQQKRVKRSLATEWANEPEWDPDLEKHPAEFLAQKIT